MARRESEDRSASVEVSDWADLSGHEVPLPARTVVRPDLWDLALEVPYGELGRSADDRIAHLLACAARACGRLPAPGAETDGEPTSIRFGVQLRSRSTQRQWTPVEMAWVRDPSDPSEWILELAFPRPDRRPDASRAPEGAQRLRSWAISSKSSSTPSGGSLEPYSR